MVPIAAGAAGVLRGTAMIGRLNLNNGDLESQFAYLAGLLLGIGSAFLFAALEIRKRAVLFSTLGFIVIVGGLARLLTTSTAGQPNTAHQFALVMELIVVPLLLLWHRRLARLLIKEA